MLGAVVVLIKLITNGADGALAHPFCIATTVYDPATVAVRVLPEVVPPGPDQVYVTPGVVELAVSTAEFGTPWHQVREPCAVIVGVAGGVDIVTITGVEAELVQPAVEIRRTEYVPESETVMLRVVSPLLQMYVVLAMLFAVSVTVAPAHRPVAPFAVTTGVAGTAVRVIVTVSEYGVKQVFAFTRVCT